MKSVIINTEIKREYPYLGINTDDLVVLFTQERTGFVVNRKTYCVFSIGYFNDTWNEESFTLFTGEIKLSN